MTTDPFQDLPQVQADYWQLSSEDQRQFKVAVLEKTRAAGCLLGIEGERMFDALMESPTKD